MSDDVKQYIRKTSKYLKKDIKNDLLTLHDMINNAEDCISILQNAFIYHSSKLLKDCEVKVEIIKKQGAQLTKAIERDVLDDPDLKPYESIPRHLIKIEENIETLYKLIDKKIRENTLFSEKAVKETIFLLQRLIEILSPTSDIILARNKFLSMYIKESQEGLGKLANEYATLHEERMITGVCLPAASSLYANMLEAIKNIAWHSKEIAIKLSEL